MHNILVIFTKEFREVLRDRKTLIFMLILPTVAVPILISVMTNFMIKAEAKAAKETLRYALFGDQYLPDLANRFNENEGFERVTLSAPSEITTAIDDGRIKFGLVIPEDAAETISNSNQLSVVLYYNNASMMSKVKRRAGTVVDEYSQWLRSQRLDAVGVSSPHAQEELLNPVVLQEIGTADTRELIGERMGGLLPYFFIIFCFIGALYPAIDLGAGEKERGTLETLLLTPVPRLHLVIGKFFVVFTTGVVSAILSVAGLGVYLLTKGQTVSGIAGEVLKSITTVDLLLVGAMMIPTAAIFAALLLTISIYAKSFKEAQSYATPLNFLCIIPAVAAMLPGIELNWKSALVPITNVSLAIKELIKGTMDYQMLIVILTSTSLIAAALIAFSAKWFERESVLFRE